MCTYLWMISLQPLKGLPVKFIRLFKENSLPHTALSFSIKYFLGKLINYIEIFITLTLVVSCFFFHHYSTIVLLNMANSIRTVQQLCYSLLHTH